jgi:hypothetical protein
MEKVKIFRITVRLDKNGFSAREELFLCEEKKLTYRCATAGIGEKVIKKVEIMKSLRDGLPPRHDRYYRETYCLEGQKQDAVTALSNDIKSEFLSVMHDITSMYDKISHLIPTT